MLQRGLDFSPSNHARTGVSVLLGRCTCFAVGGDADATTVHGQECPCYWGGAPALPSAGTEMVQRVSAHAKTIMLTQASYRASCVPLWLPQ